MLVALAMFVELGWLPLSVELLLAAPAGTVPVVFDPALLVASPFARKMA